MSDLISRDALLTKLGNVRRVTEYDETGCGMDYSAIPEWAVMLAPAVDAVPVVHARLKETGWDEAWCQWGDCTNCGHSNIIGSKYCNKCGAKLDGGAAG